MVTSRFAGPSPWLSCSRSSSLAAARTHAASRSRPAPARSPPAARIVSLSPTATEDLFAIGAGKQVSRSTTSRTTRRTRRRRSSPAITPNVEAIAGLQARPRRRLDRHERARRGARDASIPVILAAAGAELADAYAQIPQLGRATGHRAGAAAVSRR